MGEEMAAAQQDYNSVSSSNENAAHLRGAQVVEEGGEKLRVLEGAGGERSDSAAPSARGQHADSSAATQWRQQQRGVSKESSEPVLSSSSSLQCQEVAASGKGHYHNDKLQLNNNNSASISLESPGAKAEQTRPLILITDSNLAHHKHHFGEEKRVSELGGEPTRASRSGSGSESEQTAERSEESREEEEEAEAEAEDEQVEVVDGIRYRIVAAVTKPQFRDSQLNKHDKMMKRGVNQIKTNSLVKLAEGEDCFDSQNDNNDNKPSSKFGSKFNSMRRKSSAFVSSLLSSADNQLNSSLNATNNRQARAPRRLSIYEMTKSPPPETSLEIYLNDRRRSSTISSKQVQQQLEQQTTFETNYNQRQLYYKDLNKKLMNEDKKLLNVVANRGQIHRHSVDIAQLPLNSAIASKQPSAATSIEHRSPPSTLATQRKQQQALESSQAEAREQLDAVSDRLVAIRENKSSFLGKRKSRLEKRPSRK